MNVLTQPFSSDFHGGFSPHSEDRLCEAEAFKMIVSCLALDYDGTISPLDVLRSKSRVPKKTFTLLQKIGRLIPIVIVTTKDLSFVTTRTPFAHAWSTVNGLERKIYGTTQERRGHGNKLGNVSLAIEYAKSHITDTGVEIEEKHNTSKHPIAFCVDWRQARDILTAMKEADAVADCCEALGLKVIRHGCQPFFDVYPVSIDKGVALKEMLKELNLKNGVLYIGDSEADNPAFEASDVSVGVVHEKTCPQKLACDYVLKFADVHSFLSKLLANSLLFDSGFPMIRGNLEEMM